jgi:hypothetical protein
MCPCPRNFRPCDAAGKAVCIACQCPDSGLKIISISCAIVRETGKIRRFEAIAGIEAGMNRGWIASFLSPLPDSLFVVAFIWLI